MSQETEITVTEYQLYTPDRPIMLPKQIRRPDDVLISSASFFEQLEIEWYNPRDSLPFVFAHPHLNAEIRQKKRITTTVTKNENNNTVSHDRVETIYEFTMRDVKFWVYLNTTIDSVETYLSTTEIQFP